MSETQKHRATIDGHNRQADREIDWGGQAFPTEGGIDSGLYPDPGMSLRDWFAGQALIGLCQADMSEEEYTVSPDLLARTAYRMADAMIRARANGRVE